MHPPSLDGHTRSVSANSPNIKSQSPDALQVGQVFIPRQILSSGVFVPDRLLPCRLISDRAKLLWARLARYAGSDGRCFPLLSTLAGDMGVCQRQVQRHLNELVAQRFLRVRRRGLNKSNLYEFLWHPAFEVAQRLGAPEPEGDMTAVVASEHDTCGRVALSRQPLSSCNGVAKNRIEMQAKPPRVVEVIEIPAGSACAFPEKEKRKPLTQEEAGVREQLERFQIELEIAGTIQPSTVRRVMASVPADRLTVALRFVAEKLYWRRRNSPSYRRHVGWGFVFRVLEQDFAAPSRETTPAEKSPGEPPANRTGTAPPPAVSQQRPSGSPRRRGGLVRAGDILTGMDLPRTTR
jgi:hypothetical protein